MTRSIGDINKDLVKLNLLIQKRENFSNLATKRIGINLKDNRVLKPSFMEPQEEPSLQGVPYKAITYSQTVTPIITITKSPYFRDAEVGINGVNRHLDNQCLYMSVTPSAIESHITGALDDGDENVQTIIDQAARINAKIIIQTIQLRHPKKPLTLIVLGNKEKKENIEPYQYLLKKEEPFTNNSNIEKFSSKSPGLDNVNLFYMNAYDGKIELTTQGVGILYTIYKNTIAKKQPLLIHGQQGLDRTGKLVFAFELFRNFNTIFKNTDTMILADNLHTMHERLCRSRSIQVLNKIPDFKQAIVIGMTLKSCDLATECKEKLHRYISTLETKKTTKSSILIGVCESLHRAQSLTEQVEILNEVIKNPNLKEHRNFNFLPNFFQDMRSDTTSISLLKSYKMAIELRIAIQSNIASMDKDKQEQFVTTMEGKQEETTLHLV